MAIKLAFIGSTSFGKTCLEICTDLPDVKVVGIVTGKPTFSISYREKGVKNVLYSDLKPWAQSKHIQVATVNRTMRNQDLFETVKSWRPDCFLVVGWYHMLPKAWRQLAPAYGLHASLLPDYRGGTPLVWSMINGEEKTGITLFQMDGGVDTGPIVGQMVEPIYQSDTIATLYARIEDKGCELLRKAFPKVLQGEITPLQQNHEAARSFPQRSPEEGIQWYMVR